MSKTFGGWLSEQAHRHDPVGDLAVDYNSIGHASDGTNDLRKQMAALGASAQAWDAFDEAVSEWIEVCGE